MIFSDLFAFVAMLDMSVTLGSRVTLNILGVCSWVVLCYLFLNVD